MQTMCACLCNAAGHHGICRQQPDMQWRPPLTWPTTIPGGNMCRACFETVRTQWEQRQ